MSPSWTLLINHAINEKKATCVTRQGNINWTSNTILIKKIKQCKQLQQQNFESYDKNS